MRKRGDKVETEKGKGETEGDTSRKRRKRNFPAGEGGREDTASSLDFYFCCVFDR